MGLAIIGNRNVQSLPYFWTIFISGHPAAPPVASQPMTIELDDLHYPTLTKADLDFFTMVSLMKHLGLSALDFVQIYLTAVQAHE